MKKNIILCCRYFAQFFVRYFGTVDFGIWNICEVLLSRINQQKLLPELKGQRPHKGSGFYETLESTNLDVLPEKKV
ncbi:MAG: hypothetical protein EZS28_001271 [Streblomastix strix]|uniref:Uncharacterized protein n=1 Tax=Streblomastix strix TaxID=222440 RepID=A0A5J4X8T8_9EUKA|nr:MAG: hypothetical protein EZS28_001271 [Streblomastix strix]